MRIIEEVNLDFNDGAFQLTVLDLLNLWLNCFKNEESFVYKGIEMKILEYMLVYSL